MSLRRHHAKSRMGCVQCKKSHVKCNEVTPRCGYCSRRELVCSFSVSDNTNTPSPGNVHGGHGTPDRPTPTPAPARTPELGLVEGQIKRKSLSLELHGSPHLTSSTAGPSRVSQHSPHRPGPLDTYLMRVSDRSAFLSPGAATEPTPQHLHGSPTLPPLQSASQPAPLDLLTVRAQELFLMHHYTTTTSESLCDGSQIDTVWRTGLPRQAFRHSFLMDGLLAFTAVHLASETSTSTGIGPSTNTKHDQSRWIEMALEYQTRALAEFSRILSDITPELCHSAFAFTLVTILITFALPHPEVSVDPVAQSLVSRYHLRGCMAVLGPSYDILRAGEFAPLIENDHCHGAEECLANRDQVESQLTRLRELSTESSHHTSYHAAIDGLLQSVKCFNTGVIRWTLFNLDDNFVILLERRDPMALLIAAYHGVMLHSLDGKWWLRGTGARLVGGFTDILRTMRMADDEFAASVEWTRAQIGLGGGVSPTRKFF